MINERIRRAILIVFASGLVGCVNPPPPGKDTSEDWRRLGMLAYEAGRYERAAELLRRHLDDSDQDVAARYRLANALARSQAPREALATYDAVLQRDPGHARARHNRGLLRARLGVKDLRRAQQQGGLEPGTPQRTRTYLDCLFDRLRDEGGQASCQPASGEPRDSATP